MDRITILLVLFTEGLSLSGHNVSQSSAQRGLNGPEWALDDNINTCAVTNKGVNEFWRIQFAQPLTVKGMMLRLQGGNYTVEVRNFSNEFADGHVCDSIHLPFEFTVYEKMIICKPAVPVDVVIITRTDYGKLFLCDFQLRICNASLDMPREMYALEDTCRHCDEFHYGPDCQYNCSSGCETGSCDEVTGECSTCLNGYRGQQCLINDECQSDCEDCTMSCKKCEKSIGKCNELLEQEKHCLQKCSDREYWKNCTGKTCNQDDSTSATDIVFWVLFPIGFFVLIASPFLIKRLHKRFRWRLPSSSSNLYVNTDRARYNLNSSRVILEPEGDSHNLNDPYNGVIQVVVTFNDVGEKTLPIEQFVKETHQKLIKNEFYSEFRNLPNGPMNLHTAALRPENSTKNRYKKIYPYDANRVILDPPQDYINASYIQGVYKEDAYIAAQGPFTAQTVVDFWRMVWQENSKRIVMLTRLREDNVEKCQQYWPNEAGEIGPFHVIIQREEVLDKFSIRKFIVRKGEDIRRINHYQFTVWPDTRSPQSVEGLLCFRNLTKNSLRSDEGPMIVHGSAGIGRTGTFIALDFLLEKGFKEGSVDVKGCVIRLRQQRAFSLQSVDQYVFLHNALVEGLTNISWNCALHVLDEM